MCELDGSLQQQVITNHLHANRFLYDVFLKENDVRKPVEPHLLNSTTLCRQVELKQRGALWPIILIKGLRIVGRIWIDTV